MVPGDTDTDVRNVVVVVLDALRRDRVGVYADENRSLTPNIDRLVADGTLFENAFTCTNTTDPSITSIHSGRDPESVVKHHGPFVTDTEKRRAEAVDTAPERLQEAGFMTAVAGRKLGRWHGRGFEHYPESSFGRYRRRAIGERIGAISPRLRSLAGDVYEWLSSTTDSGSTDEIDEFLGTLDDRPFYGMVHLMETHVPYGYDEDDVEELLSEKDYPDRDLASFFDANSDNPYVDETMREYAEPADYEVGLARWYAKYDAAAMKSDRKLGKLVDGLAARDRLDETAVIVISDHGESLDEHGIYFEHHGLYEPQVRVPMAVRGPGVPDRRRDELVQLYDLAPTILDLLGVGHELDADGRSLGPLLGGAGEWTAREHVVFQEANAQRRLGVHTGRYKYITAAPDEVLERERGDAFRCGYCDTVHGDERELFDLDADPAETENQVGERPELADRLDSTIEAYYEGLEPVDGGDGRVEYDDEAEVMERLEDLGYR